ncbi:tetratricopeptide repeat protein [Undibacterium fentianense]|uniref:Tetratricopeptide repeat protein n=1 Tax=Undibacterium fentianense TaxID=2828728 RepID=A0A941E695_9BURK|nr:tetratricopeptide repeat protein [Undibacterium fentianense]MBR7800533.1 tetratricopeptide repeat protein [Undibacterium fentianense]
MSTPISHLLQQAIQHHQQGRLQQAEDLYVQVLQQDPDQFDALHLIGVIAKQRGDLQSALNFLGKAIFVNPSQPKAHCNLGACFQEMGKWEQALRCYESAVTLQADYALAWNNRGNTLRAMGRFQEAIDSYTRAMDYQLNYPEAYLNRALCLQEIAEHTLALQDFSDVLRLRANDIDALFGRGLSLQLTFQYDDALTAYNQAIASACKPTASEAASSSMAAKLASIYTNRGLVLSRMNKLDEALDDFLQALALRPNFVSANLQAGHLYRALQNNQQAIVHYQHALTHCNDPSHREQLRFHLASLDGISMPASAPQTYIRELFDQYAAHFDTHLQTQLKYQIPQAIEKALHSTGIAEHPYCLDLGCGTGLCGTFLRPISQELHGVDLSNNMLAKAAERSLYDALVCDDIVHFLTHTNRRYDLIVAADVLVYFGDLQPVFQQISRCLNTAGHCVFSVELSTRDDVYLQNSQRYAHTQDYLQRIATEHGLQFTYSEVTIGRYEDDQAVQSLVVVLRKSSAGNGSGSH